METGFLSVSTSFVLSTIDQFQQEVEKKIESTMC